MEVAALRPGRAYGMKRAAPWQILAAMLLGLLAALVQGQEGAPSGGDFLPQNPVTQVQLNGRLVEVEMEDLRNPLVLVQTTRGDFVLELYPLEAPRNVASFLELAGEGFYDGLDIHRIVRNVLIQGGSPSGDSSGGPGFVLPDEMSATSLGLDRMLLMDAEGRPHPRLGIQDAGEFRSKVLEPLYRDMGIRDEPSLARRLGEVEERLRSMSLQDYYALLGWRYTRAISRPPLRGVLAMANRGPNSNGSQFFIPLVDAPWLAGKTTVIGQVRGGMEVVEAIGRLPVDGRQGPLEAVTLLLVRRL